MSWKVYNGDHKRVACIVNNPEMLNFQPWRKWLRGEIPSLPFPDTKEISIEDIDLVVTLLGSRADRPYIDDGKFRIIEVKQGKGQMDYAQRRMYSLMDRVLRKGDPDWRYYGGFYLLRWSPPECQVNYKRLSMDSLAKFFLGELEILPLTSKEIMSFGAGL